MQIGRIKHYEAYANKCKQMSQNGT
jgi:hypothetical protein